MRAGMNVEVGERVLSPTARLELEGVDADLRDHFTRHFYTAYVAGVPSQMQTVRLLQRLLEQGKDGEHGACDGKDAKEDVEPQELVGEAGGGALVPVDGKTKLLGEGVGKGSLHFLMCSGAWLSLLRKVVNEFFGAFARPRAAFGVFAHEAEANRSVADA